MTRRQKLLASLLLVMAIGVVAGPVTFSAFSGTTTNGGNSFTAGTVALSDNDAGASMLTLTNAKPGDSVTGCIRISYTGTLASTVRLYANTTGSLGQYLDLVVTRGTNSGGFGSCGSFSADGTNYIGQGNGVVYSGTVSAFPASHAAGLVDPSGSPATWNQNDAHWYSFVVTLQNNDAAQGLSGTAGFTWEARNQ
jgi:Camelysin metallo-endopeptidase